MSPTALLPPPRPWKQWHLRAGPCYVSIATGCHLAGVCLKCAWAISCIADLCVHENMLCILLQTWHAHAQPHTDRLKMLHRAQGGAVNPESSPPVRAYQYITRNRASLTSLKITGDLGDKKETKQVQRQEKTPQERLVASNSLDCARCWR